MAADQVAVYRITQFHPRSEFLRRRASVDPLTCLQF
jgi:hypothetical protein